MFKLQHQFNNIV